MSMPLLEIRQLRAGYGGAEVLHGIDLVVSETERFLIRTIGSELMLN